MKRLACLSGVLAALAAIFLSVVLATTLASAQALEMRQITEARFRDWLIQTVWPDAREQGVSREIFERALATVVLEWDLPELQGPGRATPPDEQRQAEFQSPGRYFKENQLDSLAHAGRGILRQWAPTLDEIERRS